MNHRNDAHQISQIRFVTSRSRASCIRPQDKIVKMGISLWGLGYPTIGLANELHSNERLLRFDCRGTKAEIGSQPAEGQLYPQ